MASCPTVPVLLFGALDPPVAGWSVVKRWLLSYWSTPTVVF